jgi:hypothetical protein
VKKQPDPPQIIDLRPHHLNLFLWQFEGWLDYYQALTDDSETTSQALTLIEKLKQGLQRVRKET